MTHTHDFLPRDRVVTTGQTMQKCFGTVTRVTAVFGVFVIWDGVDHEAPVNFDEIAHEPIEPGCWVRFVDPNDKSTSIHTKWWHKPFEISNAGRLIDGAYWYHVSNNGSDGTYFKGDCLFRIAEPVPASLAEVVPEDQVQKLADWITANVPGEPSQSEGAVDTTIRLLAYYRGAIAEMARAIRGKGHDNRISAIQWADKYDPNPIPVFKRGDLVRWCIHTVDLASPNCHTGRIVNLEPVVEVMTEHGEFIKPNAPIYHVS